MTDQQQHPSAATAESGATTIAPKARGARGRIIGAVAGLAALAVGGGFLAVDPLGLRDSAPGTGAAVLPATASAFVEFDVEPDLLQAAEMARFAMRVKPVSEKVMLSDQGDLRQQLFESLAGDCAGVDYAQDVAPWLGRKVSLASEPRSSEPVWALQVSDEQAARAGVQKLAACGAVPGGSAARDGYLVLADSPELASSLVEQGRTRPLSEDPVYSEDLRRFGRLGLVTLWGTKDGLLELADDTALEARTAGLGTLPGRLFDEVRRADWRSGGAVLRFIDGVPEVKLVAKSNQHHKTSTTEMGLAGLPQDTVLAYGISDGDQLVQESWPEVERVVDRLGVDLDSLTGRVGVELPRDQVVLGKEFKVSYAPGPASARTVQDLPLQLQTVGRSRRSPAQVEEIVRRSGVEADGWRPSHRRRTVVVSQDDERSRLVLRSRHKLTHDDVFKLAYPKPEQAQIGFYANLQTLGPVATQAVPAPLRPWVEELGAVGVNAHNEDADYTVARLRVTAR